MGWKCPNCRNHVYKSGKCPYCSPDVCWLCGDRVPTRHMHEHHVSYRHNATVDLCEGCHEKVHFENKRGPADDHDLLDRLRPRIGRQEARQRGYL